MPTFAVPARISAKATVNRSNGIRVSLSLIALLCLAASLSAIKIPDSHQNLSPPFFFTGFFSFSLEAKNSFQWAAISLTFALIHLFLFLTA